MVPSKLQYTDYILLSFSLQPKYSDRIKNATTWGLWKVNKRWIEDHTQNTNKGMGVNLLGLFFPLIMGWLWLGTSIVSYFFFFLFQVLDYFCISMSLRISLSVFTRILGEILSWFSVKCIEMYTIGANWHFNNESSGPWTILLNSFINSSSFL